jgi:hypothetical protein
VDATWRIFNEKELGRRSVPALLLLSVKRGGVWDVQRRVVPTAEIDVSGVCTVCTGAAKRGRFGYGGEEAKRGRFAYTPNAATDRPRPAGKCPKQKLVPP